MIRKGCAMLCGLVGIGYVTLLLAPDGKDTRPSVVTPMQFREAMQLCRDSTHLAVDDAQDLGSLRIYITLSRPGHTATCLTQFGHIQHISYATKTPKHSRQ